MIVSLFTSFRPTLSRADPVSPNSLQTYLENKQGLKAYTDGQMDEAQKKFGEAQARDPHRPELFFNEGVVAMKKEDYDSAIQAFSTATKEAQALGNAKLEATAKFNLASALAKKNDFKDAAKSYLSSIASAEKAQDSGLVADAKKNLQLLAQQKQQQKQQQSKDQSQKQPQDDKKDQKNQDKSDQKKDQNKDQEKKEQPKEQNDQAKKDEPPHYQDETHNSRQKFKSQKLSGDDANRVMAELNNRERELQARLQKNHGEPQKNQKDW